SVVQSLFAVARRARIVEITRERARVPPAHTVAMRVRADAQADVLALVPVEKVVPALETGTCPVGDLVVVEASGSQHRGGELVLFGKVVLIRLSHAAARYGLTEGCPL